MSNKIKLTVGGTTYSVYGDESENYMKELGNELQEKLMYFARKNPNLSTVAVAVMTALDSCDRAKKAEAEIARLKKQIALLEQNTEKQMRIDD